jgi:hypothetical protein
MNLSLMIVIAVNFVSKNSKLSKVLISITGLSILMIQIMKALRIHQIIAIYSSIVNFVINTLLSNQVLISTIKQNIINLNLHLNPILMITQKKLIHCIINVKSAINSSYSLKALTSIIEQNMMIQKIAMTMK